LTAQSYFKHITDSDVRKTLSDEHNLMLEEDMSPIGFFDENIYRQDTFREGDDMWSVVEDRGYKTSTL
jgi:hypothetical protein